MTAFAGRCPEAASPLSTTCRQSLGEQRRLSGTASGPRMAKLMALSPYCEKLRLDLTGAVGMCPDMSEDPGIAELVQRLCLEAGRIMEDESPALAMAQPTSSDRLAARLIRAREAGEDIAALVAAAEVIARRAGIET